MQMIQDLPANFGLDGPLDKMRLPVDSAFEIAVLSVSRGDGTEMIGNIDQSIVADHFQRADGTSTITVMRIGG